MIDIADLEGSTIKEIGNLVAQENADQYEIYVPKSTRLHFSRMADVAYDYAYAAYAGQLLANVAERFEYENVPPDVHESIRFTVKTGDQTALADAILEVSYLYVNEPDDPEVSSSEDVDEFLENVEEGNLIPACPYFTDLYFEYIEKDIQDHE